ncbi:MAG TPA: DUF6789 family protein [Terriglobales bacterium]|nr:DUF6789 family protein [Terriglobales bacterium]
MRPKPSMALVGGLMGTPAMTALIFVLAPMVGMKMDIVEMLAEPLGGWKMGMLVHILNGAIIFPLAFVFLFYRLLPGSPATKGVVFGVVLWLASQLLVMPIMGAGLFSAHVGGIRAAAVLLFGHVVYGWLVGLFPMLAQEASGVAYGQGL